MTSENLMHLVDYNPRIAHSILLKAYYSSHDEKIKSDISKFAYSLDNIDITTNSSNNSDIEVTFDNVDVFEFNKVKKMVHLGLKNFYNKLSNSNESNINNIDNNSKNFDDNNNIDNNGNNIDNNISNDTNKDKGSKYESQYSIDSFNHLIKTFIYDSVYYNKIVAHMSRKEFSKVKDLIEEARVSLFI